MCGIGVVLTSATTNLENHAAYTQQIRSGIRNRGPDSFGEMELMENRATFMPSGTYNVMILLAIPQFLQTLLRSIEIRPLDHSSAVVSELRFLACAIRLP